MKHVLLTRPVADSLSLARELAERYRIKTMIQPLFTITAPPGGFSLHGLAPASFQALLFTSRHAVTAFTAAYAGWYAVPAFCIGQRTAELATAQGFTTVHSADGDAADLARLVIGQLNPAHGPVLRLTGYDTPDPLSDSLAKAGFPVTRRRAYGVAEIPDFSGETRSALTEGSLDGVLFFSPETARRFVTLVGERNLAPACHGLVAWCISDATAASLADLSFRTIRMAARPTQAAMLQMVADH